MKKKVMINVIKILSYLISTFLILVILLLLFIFISNRSGAKYPSIGPYQIYMVLSDSMSPVFRTGDAVIIKKGVVNDLETGDIITFAVDNADDVLVTHRIIELEENNKWLAYITKGDNNEVKDPGRVMPEDVIGKYVFHIPKIGYLFDLLKEYPIIPMLSFLVVIAFIGGSMVVTAIRERRSYKE